MASSGRPFTEQEAEQFVSHPHIPVREAIANNQEYLKEAQRERLAHDTVRSVKEKADAWAQRHADRF